MDENPINPGDKTPETEPIAAPEEVKETAEPVTEPVVDEPVVDAPAADEPAVEAPTDEPVTEPVADEPVVPEPVTPEPIAPEPVVAPEPALAPAPEPVATPMMGAAPQPTMDQFPQKKKHTGLIIGVIIAILLIATGVVLCVILLNSSNESNEGDKNKDNSGQVDDNKDKKKDDDKDGKKTNNKDDDSDTSVLSCVAKGSTWSYSMELTVDNEELKTTKMSQSLVLSDDYTADSLDSSEQLTVASLAAALAQYEEAKNNGVSMAGVTYTSKGDLTGGAGWSAKLVLDREKIKNADVLEQFEQLDGKTAEELKEAADEDGSTTCTIK